MANKHLHRYRLKNLTRDPSKNPYYVYICTKQDCSHNIRVELVEGKAAECNRCGDPFIMRLAKLKQHGDKRIVVKPHCDDCTRTPDRLKKKKERVETSIEQLMKNLIPEGF